MRNSCPSMADDRFCTAFAASCTPQRSESKKVALALGAGFCSLAIGQPACYNTV